MKDRAGGKRNGYELKFRASAKAELEALRSRYPILVAKVYLWLRELASDAAGLEPRMSVPMQPAVEFFIERYGSRPQPITRALRMFVDSLRALHAFLVRQPATQSRAPSSDSEIEPQVVMAFRPFRFAGNSMCELDVFFEIDRADRTIVVAMILGLPAAE
jgi:hypothetical protein